MDGNGRRGAADFTYFSATRRHWSPSPPVTSIHESFNPLPYISLSSTISAKGVWLCTNMPVSSGTPRRSLTSSTRSDSYLPPPFVRRMKGIRWDCRYSSAFWARGSALELRSRTPSMLVHKRQRKNSKLRWRDGHAEHAYSNANAKSGISGLGSLVAV